jgi:hypothetical protein
MIQKLTLSLTASALVMCSLANATSLDITTNNYVVFKDLVIKEDVTKVGKIIGTGRAMDVTITKKPDGLQIDLSRKDILIANGKLTSNIDSKASVMLTENEKQVVVKNLGGHGDIVISVHD